MAAWANKRFGDDIDSREYRTQTHGNGSDAHEPGPNKPHDEPDDRAGFDFHNGNLLSLKEYVEILSRVVKIDFEIMKKEYKLEIGDYLADYSKFNKATGWKPSNIELKEMITETVDFYKVNGL